MSYQDIVYEKKGGVARITFNRPEKRNCARFQTLNEFNEAWLDARMDPSVVVIVTTGTGDKAYCAGADLDGGEGSEIRIAWFRYMKEIAHCPKITIAAVNGWAVGGGSWGAYLHDFTIASENATFLHQDPVIGSAPAGFQVPWLVRVVGEKRAREIFLYCRAIKADEALQWGLANKVVALEKLQEETEAWCHRFVEMSPTALRMGKRIFVEAAKIASVVGDIAEEFDAGPYLDSEESHEGMRAFVEKRKPDFQKYVRKA